MNAILSEYYSEWILYFRLTMNIILHAYYNIIVLMIFCINTILYINTILCVYYSLWNTVNIEYEYYTA